MTIWCKFYFYVVEHPTECMAVFISTLALISTIWFNVRDHKHKRLSVKPLLTNSIDMNYDFVIALTLFNRGIGPALIDNIIYRYKGIEYNNTKELIDCEIKRFSNKSNLDLTYNKYSLSMNNSVMKEGESNVLYSTKVVSNSREDIDAFYNLVNSIEVDVYYRDIYGKKYLRRMK